MRYVECFFKTLRKVGSIKLNMAEVGIHQQLLVKAFHIEFQETLRNGL
jgi:hypothetical protein